MANLCNRPPYAKGNRPERVKALRDAPRAKPEGRVHTPEAWKALFMHAHGYEVRFLTGLNGEPFPVGFRTSNLSKRMMADLITFIQAWGDERGVPWSDRPMKGYDDGIHNQPV